MAGAKRLVLSGRCPNKNFLMFDQQFWNEWSVKEEENYQLIKGEKKYLKKSYFHLDKRFWFPDRKNEIANIVKNKLLITNKVSGKKTYWSFCPFQRVLIKTPRYNWDEENESYFLKNKIRPICFASHIDSLILGYYAFALTKKYETYIEEKGFNECVLAYRSNFGGKCNIQFSKEVFDYIKQKQICTAVALDIKGYFDHIDHKRLKEAWKEVLGGPIPDDQFKIYKALTQYSYVNEGSIIRKYNIDLRKLRREGKMPSSFLDIIEGEKPFEKFEKLRKDNLIVVNNKPDKKTNRLRGIPQGSSISALMSNVYLIFFDELMYKKSVEEGFLYRRYCDDIMIVCEPNRAEELKHFAINKISEELLIIQDKKVETTDFFLNSKGNLRAFNRKKIKELNLVRIPARDEKRVYKALQYLGFEFDGQNIRIRSSSLSRYFRKMKARLDKTVSMAYSPNAKSNRIFKRQIFERYTHLGHRNFLSYAYKASLQEYTNSEGTIKAGMNSLAIRQQLNRHFTILINSLKAKNRKQFNKKLYEGKVVNPMIV